MLLTLAAIMLVVGVCGCAQTSDIETTVLENVEGEAVIENAANEKAEEVKTEEEKTEVEEAINEDYIREIHNDNDEIQYVITVEGIRKRDD